MPSRWMVLPRAGSGTDEDPYRPKYTDQEGVKGWSGQQISVPESAPGPASGKEIYIAKVYATKDLLDQAESVQDVITLGPDGDYSYEQAKNFLNTHLDLQISWGQFDRQFRVGRR